MVIDDASLKIATNVLPKLASFPDLWILVVRLPYRTGAGDCYRVFCDVPGALFPGLASPGPEWDGPFLFCPFVMCITCLAEAGGADEFSTAHNFYWRLPDDSNIEFQWIDTDQLTRRKFRGSRAVTNFRNRDEDNREAFE